MVSLAPTKSPPATSRTRAVRRAPVAPTRRAKKARARPTREARKAPAPLTRRAKKVRAAVTEQDEQAPRQTRRGRRTWPAAGSFEPAGGFPGRSDRFLRGRPGKLDQCRRQTRQDFPLLH